jgi:hypothetical protein
VSTSIDCNASTLDDGRFKLDLSISAWSVYANDQIPASEVRPSGETSLRTFVLINTVIMKDGQTIPLTSAADKLTGEVTKVDVTLAVLK